MTKHHSRTRTALAPRVAAPVLLALLAAQASSQTPIHTIEGNVGSLCGTAVAGVPDVNGDGHDDFLVGYPGDSTAGAGAGRAALISGRNGSELLGLPGPLAAGRFGSAVASAGDVNQDGVPDLIVGAPLAAGSGRAYVYSGMTGALLYSLSGQGVVSEHFGASVASAGDVNGDGTVDLIVGAPAGPSGFFFPGWASVFSGVDGALLQRFEGTTNSRLGQAVAGAGDLNADGFDDVLVGSPQWGAHPTLWVGRVAAHSGVDGSLLFEWTGSASMDRLGTSLAGPGDLDGDGVPDVLVGVPFADDVVLDRGKAIVFSGASGAALYELQGPLGLEGFGSVVSALGDLDHDGVRDLFLAVGDTPNNSNALSGRARLFSGASGRLLFALDAPAVDDGFGVALAAAGDLDADGVADILVGAPRHAGTGGLTGAAYAYSGADLRAGTSFCGGGSASACPCGNSASDASGCANSTGDGATLTAFGIPDVGDDSLALQVRGCTAFEAGLFFGGGTTAFAAVFGDGLRCVAGPLVRVEVVRADATGLAWSSNSIAGVEGLVGGELRGYQFVYRDPGGPCAGGFNTTGGMLVQW